MMRICSILFLALACAAPIAAQNEVELGRLATDQRQIAEQVRRLDQLLGVLEERDRADGRDKEAEVLAVARETLRGSANAPVDLAGALESVALELSRKQTGSALESQAAAIELLQELLEKLVKDQRRELDRQQIADLQQWQKGLEELAAQQQDLMDRAQELENREQTEGETDDAARSELAEDQQALADEIEEFNEEQARKGMTSEDSEKAEEAAERAAEELQPPQSAEQQPSTAEEQQEQSMDDAQKQQGEAKDALERQEEKVQEELDRREDERKKQILLDVKEEAQKLLQRHSALLDEYVEIHEENEGGRLSRGDRSRLRRAAQDERSIAEETGELLLIIDEYGADSFPFFMAQLQEDHDRLATQIGPPRYRLNDGAVALGERLNAGWTDLVDAIQTEEDRLREEIEKPPSAPGQQPEEEEELSPLVQFTAELQLLKRMQATMTDQLTQLALRLSAYERAGVEADPIDIADLLLLQDRQQELALQFQSIVDRAMGATEEAEGEEL